MNFLQHHTGIISKNIERDAAVYEKLGYEPLGGITEDLLQNNRLQFLSCGGHVIELIQPMNEKSTVKNARPGNHHICYEVADINAAKEYLRVNRMGTVIAEFPYAPALNNRPIVFACLLTGAVIEFLESGR